MPEKNPPSDLRRSLVKYAANILGRRPYFTSVLKQKLIIRAGKLGQSDYETEVNNIIRDLSASGFLDDQYLAEAYVRKELRKGWGPKIISLKMKRLGIETDISLPAIQKEADLTAQIDAIKHHLVKLRRYEKRVQINKLFQRGFHAPAILRVFDSGVMED